MKISELKNKKIRFFLLQSNDTWLFLFKEFYFWYLLNLLIDKLWFKLWNIEAEIVFPFKKYLNNLYDKSLFFEEEVYIFYLENAYHSNNYWYQFVNDFLDKINERWEKKEVYIYSLKISLEEANELLRKYDFVKLIIRTDIEYFFNKFFFDNLKMEDIPNILFKTDNWIVETKKESVEYDLWEYILWWHYSWYIDKFKLSKDYIISILDNDNKYTDDLVTYRWPKEKRINDFRYRPDTSAMISTWRWCKYNCSYCYRWVKYSKVRLIPLDIIKKDLDYLSSMYYEDIYVYDDCFLTTNIWRIDEIINLFSNYNFYYGISIRYEICSAEIFEKLSNINLYRVQIWLQSISLSTNANTWRGLNLSKFKYLVKNFRERWTIVSIDIILWLPWETLKDFIDTLNFAVSLDPWSIHINTLFLNPWTKLTKEKDKYWIATNEDKKLLFSVPTLVSSNSFSQADIVIAKKYIEKISKKYLSTKIILR